MANNKSNLKMPVLIKIETTQGTCEATVMGLTFLNNCRKVGGEN